MTASRELAPGLSGAFFIADAQQLRYSGIDSRYSSSLAAASVSDCIFCRLTSALLLPLFYGNYLRDLHFHP